MSRWLGLSILMAFQNNHTLALEALASSGCVIPTEQRAAIDTSLGIKKEEAGLKALGLWGRVYTHTGKDYLIAQGCNGITAQGNNILVDTKNYYRNSLDGAKWLDLAPLSDDAYEICKGIRGGFKGDPSHRYQAQVRRPPPPPTPPPPAGGGGDEAAVKEEEKPAELEVTTDNAEEEGEEGEDGVKRKKKDPNMMTVEFGELDRLTAFIRAVDYDCGVVPVGAFILDAKKQLVPNTLFPGVKFADKLDAYGHLFQHYNESLLEKDITGSWSVQLVPISNDVILRSLWWPGYAFYYSCSTNTFGSLYVGVGEKNLDFAFMIG